MWDTILGRFWGLRKICSIAFSCAKASMAKYLPSMPFTHSNTLTMFGFERERSSLVLLDFLFGKIVDWDLPSPAKLVRGVVQ